MAAAGPGFSPPRNASNNRIKKKRENERTREARNGGNAVEKPSETIRETRGRGKEGWNVSRKRGNETKKRGKVVKGEGGEREDGDERRWRLEGGGLLG